MSVTKVNINFTSSVDTNGEGTYDAANDPPLAGVTVLLSGVSNSETITSSGVTGSNGEYVWDRLYGPGTYEVAVSPPAGYVQSWASNIGVQTSLMTQNATLTTAAGFYQPGTVAGNVSGATGVTVELMASGSVAASATTDASGNYSFSGLVPGSYQVAVVPPAVTVSGVGSVTFSGTVSSAVSVASGGTASVGAVLSFP